MTALILLPETAPFPTFFITLLGGANSDVLSDVAVDQATGDIFVDGYYGAGGTSGNDGFLAKFDMFGSLQWQKGIRSSSDPGANSNDRANTLSIQGSDLFISGQNGLYSHWVAKWDLSGNIVWQRELGGDSSTPVTSGYTNISDGTDMYTAGGYNPGGGASPQMTNVAKMNLTTGAEIWQRRLGAAVPSSSSQNRWNASVIDGSNLLYLAGEERQTFGVQNGLVARYDSSGSLQAQTRFGDATNFVFFLDCALDSSGDLYVIGQVDENSGVGPQRILLVKYNPATLGVIWQTTIGDGTTGAQGTGIWIDNSDNIFITGWSPDGIIGTNDIIVARYNTSGALQWHNIFGANLSETGQNVGGDNNGSIIFTGNTGSDGAGSNDGLVVKVPDDGSIPSPGTWGAFTYQAGAMANGSSAYATGSPSTVNSSGSGSSAGSMDTYTSSLTEDNVA